MSSLLIKRAINTILSLLITIIKLLKWNIFELKVKSLKFFNITLNVISAIILRLIIYV